jgi:RNA polymerase sigma-70 factor (ECF subfamily)
MTVPGPDPDVALMLRVKQGDRTAFTALVDRYKRPITNLIFRTIGDPTEAEDIAQTVFVQVWRSAHRYRDSARFSTWIYTIARNLCLNEIRRRSRHRADSLDAPHPETEEAAGTHLEDRGAVAPPDAILQGELESKIQAALADLPETQRTAVLLFRQEELSYEEIAEVLGCSLSATKSLIHRARETLRLRLKAYLRTGAWGEGEQL